MFSSTMSADDPGMAGTSFNANSNFDNNNGLSHNNSINNGLNNINGLSNNNGYDSQLLLDDGSLILNSVRNRKKAIGLPCCPICSCTLRANELQSHLGLEMEKLSKISCSGKRKSAGTPNSSGSSSNGLNEDVDISGSTGSEVYERVRRNRSRRLRVARGRGVTCPVCGERLGSGAESHVDACLRSQQEEESVDVEGDQPGFGTVYSWCSVERVRAGALQLAEGGALPQGALRVRRASTDSELVVDGDEDTLLYGPSQYSPERIAQEEEVDTAEPEAMEVPECPLPTSFPSPPPEGAPQHSQPQSLGAHQMVVGALKERVRELEQRLAHAHSTPETKCLICMGPYTEPVVSIQCWHAHCENCWLESLRAKKTCPQCNAITTTSHLRRIYI